MSQVYVEASFTECSKLVSKLLVELNAMLMLKLRAKLHIRVACKYYFKYGYHVV